MEHQMKRFLAETWANPVFDDTFPEEKTIERLTWVRRHLGTLALPVALELRSVLSASTEWSQAAIAKVVEGEVRDKTIAFSAALSVGEIENLQSLRALSVAVGLMYTADQTIDRGDEPMVDAVERWGSHTTSHTPNAPKTQARSIMLSHIQNKIDILARPEDAPFVKDCFLQQVLENEALMYRWSREYESSSIPDRQIFLAEHARKLAETTTVNAGFPSISSSLYAIYRQHDTTLPPLSEIYTSQAITNLLQVCNVTARIWDELGDWEMDSGRYPEKGIFVINPFNQYHPATVDRYCELAFITNARQVNAIQHTFANFHHSEAARQQHTSLILEVLRDHIRQYMAQLKNNTPDVWNKFEHYITLCKRVMEISYVNRMGDIALAQTDSTSHDE
ncbi:MAG TPA: hypothetical protein VFZ58_00940 [Candidatus Saccharimonadales bacterium]